MAVTTWNTAPDYDEWGFDSYWDCADWMQYHKLLKIKFGKEKAKYVWDYAYAQGSFGARHFDCRTFNNAFREYVRKEDLNTYASAGIFTPVLDLTGSGLEVIGGIADFVGSAGKNIKGIGWLVIAGVFIFAGVRIYKIAKA